MPRARHLTYVLHAAVLLGLAFAIKYVDTAAFRVGLVYFLGWRGMGKGGR